MKVLQSKNEQKYIFEMLPKALLVLKKNLILPFVSESLIEKYAHESPPLRAELFNAAQIEVFAKKLAKNHELISEKPSEKLLKRLAENESALLDVHTLLIDSLKENRQIVPAGEWLLDNFYLIEQQIYTGKKHLPKGYSKGLPRIKKDIAEGLPRVYDIAVGLISHSDGRVDINSLTSFISAYQSVVILNLGELWAIPIMLRLALIENLRRLATQIAIDLTYEKLADYWADEMIKAAENDPKSLVLVIADMANSDPPILIGPFVAQLIRKLQGKGSGLTLPLTWIEERLQENGLTGNQIISEENQKQAEDQVSISNSIGSLRFLGSTDWRDFVESTSIVEKRLSEDIGRIYKTMDFFTRDNYRHVVEIIAKRCKCSEEEVASAAIKLSKERVTRIESEGRHKHVGYYLVAEGLLQLESVLNLKHSTFEKLGRFFKRNSVLSYIGSIIVFTVFFSWPMLKEVINGNTKPRALVFVIIAIILIAVSQLSITLINWLVTIIIKPKLLPRLNFAVGIPEQSATMVVIPTIIKDISNVTHLIEGLEVRFLANRDKYLYFALLTDFKDAGQETLDSDEALLQFAADKIMELNKKYQRHKNNTFFLFHRPRRFNANENVWMGYERKRGKLMELNALLRGYGWQYFSLIIGDESIFASIKYIISLDSDTQLPRDAAWKMIGTLAHPLNHAVYSEIKQRVISGYTILQPRVSNSLVSEGSSLYACIHGNEPGTDPYTRAISEVYQDVFGEGSFIGKGIYEIDTFQQALDQKFPENRILSHDLLEGCYSRSGLVSDVQLYEEYPASYQVDLQRRYRWIRGDWQILNWILPYVPSYNKKLVKNPLSTLSRWKIFDNIRRSLVPISLTFILLFGCFFSGNTAFWIVSVLAIITLPSVIVFSWNLFHKSKDILLLRHFIYTVKSTSDLFTQCLTDLILLPYEGSIYLKAILKTLWRTYVSHKKLLEWSPSKIVQDEPQSIFKEYKAMWFIPLGTIVLLFYIKSDFPNLLVGSLPILVLWFFSPLYSWWISRTNSFTNPDLSYEQISFLRRLARKTWHFFETFVVESGNWLPPDNYQEQPVERIARRTSPTNLGLNLLANLAAYDFKYLTATEFMERTASSLNVMRGMEKYRGHFYNWYDTETIQPLSPRYISTVDSGNLVGHLFTLKQGLQTMIYDRIIDTDIFNGLLDTAKVMVEQETVNSGAEQMKIEIFNLIMERPKDLIAIKTHLDRLMVLCGNILLQVDKEKNKELFEWSLKLKKEIGSFINDLAIFLPWLFLSAPEKFSGIYYFISEAPTYYELSKIEEWLLPKLADFYNKENSEEEEKWLDLFRDNILQGSQQAKEFILTAEQLSLECTAMADLDYDFLYNRSQHLLSIGYNVDEARMDNSYYDLLASEARLATFTAIAQGKLPQESWFALGRQLTNFGSTPVLLSWSGSMFEYLMPLLVMPGYKDTLLDETVKGIVQKQIEYGKKRGVPWGISESGYNQVDANLNYQYRAFGVPGTGFKRGLGEDLVVAPYATEMALMVKPVEAYSNLKYMQREGFEGEYGFYEAIDYTSTRVPRKQNNALIRSYMVHHKGMGFLSLAYCICNKPMQKRFESEAQFKATLLLLQERVPRLTSFYSSDHHISDSNQMISAGASIRVINTPNTLMPEVQLLSNGRYNVVVTNAGGGYSHWKDIAITRWREDSTCDNWGTFCFIRELEKNRLWSAAYQPTLQQGENYEAVFSQGRAEFRRRDYFFETHTEVVVSTEDDVELRRLRITNRSRQKKLIEITSYAEVVLTMDNADIAHPAFSNLFVQTEIIKSQHAIICTRRPRNDESIMPWMFHLMEVYEAEIINISYETDRSKFIGRCNTIHHPAFLEKMGPLNDSEGPILDPIVAIQYRIILESQATATVDMLYGIGESKEICDSLVEKYQDRYMSNRAFELTWTHSQVILRQIDAMEEDAQLYGKLASSIVFTNPSFRTEPSVIIKNHRGQSGLWSYAISGDYPIVLLKIEDVTNIKLAQQLIKAHAYWRLKGLIVDLVIWNEDHGSYRQNLQNQLLALIAPGVSANVRDKPGGIFIRSIDQIPNEDRILFQTVARIVISDLNGTLEEQVNKRVVLKNNIPFFSPTKIYASILTSVKLPQDLLFFNGNGGFSKDGNEYVIITTNEQKTPAPWVNVIANPNFGTVISENGQSYTWLDNSHEFRLTPWHNDPVTDKAGEAYYIRDEESGRFWSPMPLSLKVTSSYITRHGFGYSLFDHSEDGILTEVCIYVDIQDAVKFITIKFFNESGRTRKLSVTSYIEWVLGDIRSKSQMHIVTEFNASYNTIFANNAYNTEFGKKVAFVSVNEPSKYYTADRTEFIGRNGTLSNPDGLNRARLSGKTGGGLDPCAALQVIFELQEKGEHETIFYVGAGSDRDDAHALVKKYKEENIARISFDKVKNFWNKTLQAIQITTPDPALNILTNGWLNYQTLSSRIWGRSGFYQSGGAFGYRDQLQDMLSLLHTHPELVREQILLCASRQFKEGDVQHWWHPPSGRGVRTTCSDDFLWLPFVTTQYIKTTGDLALLDVSVPFLEGRALNENEDSYYDQPSVSDLRNSLYVHCVISIEHGLAFGEHGLPLIGSGDWNDGMDKIGQKGKGESVWLAFFLYDILQKFTEIAKLKDDKVFLEKCKMASQNLLLNIDKNAWDGLWYLRAYFDDGTPLGSKVNDECMIDSLPQSWSVISGAGELSKTRIALASAEKYLVKKNDQIIQLFEPPFDKSSLNPGYIKGYVPGVRENGGQYTHASVWLIMAIALSGDSERALELINMINPINHGKDEQGILVYKVEPYVMAADVYSINLHKGRGGWTWYTGSAGWMYQLIISTFIGLKKEGDQLSFSPRIPKAWPVLTVKYKFLNTTYEIILNKISDPSLVRITLDDKNYNGISINLTNDEKEHKVNVFYL